MRTSALFDAKILKFKVCPHGQGGSGLSQCGHFSDKGGGIKFSRFCVDVLYGDGP